MLKKSIFLLLISGLLVTTSFSYTPGINVHQPIMGGFKKDSVKSSHSPTKAAILSAIIPGAGQVYNKKYWKVPVIYGLMGTAAYFMFQNRAELRDYKEDLNYATDTSSATMPIHFPGVNTATLAARRDFHKQNRDYAILAMGLVYALNIIDATVDAHLFEFNVNKKLAGRIQPQINPNGFKGARLTLRF